MFKKIYERIEKQDREIEAMRDKIWDIENPYGTIERYYEIYLSSVVYKSSRKSEVTLGCIDGHAEYKIKRTSNVTYIFLSMDRPLITGGIEKINRTYAVKGDTCMQIENPIGFDAFDKQGTI